MKKQAACGAWPANAIADVLSAIQNLQSEGFVENDFTLLIPQELKFPLWRQVHNLGAMTYWGYLKNAGIVKDILVTDWLKKNEIVIMATKKNMPFFCKIGDTKIVNPDTEFKITDIEASSYG